MPARRLIATLFATTALVAATPASALAAPTLAGEFPVTGKPRHLTLGPDGNVWFTQGDSPMDYEFGRIAPNGAVTEFNSPNNNNNPNGITTGPDGRLWIVEANGKLVEVDPANPNAGLSHTILGLTDPREITTGSDGNLWAASGEKVLRISPAGALLNSYDVAGMAARGITAASDGNLWIADFGSGRIVKVTTAGVATPYAVGGGPQDVVAGPTGQLAYSNQGANPHEVGRMALDGSLLPATQMPLTDPFGITFGSDGAYWTAQFAANKLGRISPTGNYTQLTLSAGSGPRYVTRGANDTLWVGLETARKIARVTDVLAPAPPATPVIPDATKPRLTRLRLAPATFRVARGATAVLARTAAGTRIRFSLSEAARVTMRIERAAAGRVRRGRCVAPTRSLRRARRCTRWVRVGSLTRDAKAGARSVRFSGRIGKRALNPGRYRVAAVAIDPTGNRSTRKTARFRVVKR